MDLSFSPRVVGSQRPDCYSIESFLDSPQFAGKQGEELVLALYDYLTSPLDGLYHFWPPDETAGDPRLRRAVSDPVKLLNAYGWAICGQSAALVYSLYRAAGLRARQIGLPGHVLTEVWYDGRWHVLDTDMRTWFRTSDGHIASAYELAQNPEELIRNNPNKSDPCDLPDRPLKSYAEMYAKCETTGGRVKNVLPPWRISAHTMDFRLRPGETLVRSQEHEGRFHMPQAWKESIQRFKSEWHGVPRERFEPWRTFGNGRWIYEPRLAAEFADFDEGLFEPSELRQDSRGLLGPGSATFRILSPYPFCGLPDWGADSITHRDGVWLSLAGEGRVTVEVTDTEGKWTSIAVLTGAFDGRTDITGLMSSRYECLIRVGLDDGSRLDRMRFEGYILTAPAAIPRLAEGDNHLELGAGDKHGCCTLPWLHRVDFRATADLPSQ